MKFKYFVSMILGAAVLFAAAMAYLFYTNRPVVDSEKKLKPIVAERAATVSGKAGKLAVFYAGDLVGNLGPCT